MVVTINTDASHHKALRVGSYAFWIKSDAGVIRQYGSFKGHVNNIMVAELMAIVNALHCLSKAQWKEIRRVVINTDCLNVIHYLDGDDAAIKRYEIDKTMLMPAGKIYFQYKREFFPDAHFFLRHVRAHTRLTDSRKFVNDWCDTSAKKALGVKLESIRHGK